MIKNTVILSGAVGNFAQQNSRRIPQCKAQTHSSMKAFPLVGKVADSLTNRSDEGICLEATKGLPPRLR